MEGDYRFLEELRRKLWRTRERLPSGELRLAKFYDAFSSVPSAQLELVISQAEEWARTDPKSYLARYLLGLWQYELAWKKRSSGYAKDLTDDQVAAYRSDLQASYDSLSQLEANPEADPEVYARLIALCREAEDLCQKPAQLYLQKSMTLEPSYLGS